MPGAQAVHWRSATVVPAELTNVPGWQSVQGVQLVAFDVVLNVPLAHAVQVRSVVALPLEVTRVPGAQSVQATQAVAAFASWSHVPGAQGCLGASPPGQWPPVAHGVQTAGAVRSVPAGQPPVGTQLDWFALVVVVPAGHVAHWRSEVVLPGALT